MEKTTRIVRKEHDKVFERDLGMKKQPRQRAYNGGDSKAS